MSNVFALTTDREQPIQIEADTATIDNVKGIAIYEGSVIVTQGSIRINASRVTINYNEKQDIEKVIAKGKPARFKQRLDRGEDIKAKASLMEYNAIKSILTLKKKAELRKEKGGEDTYISSAPHITYDTQDGIIRADQGNNKRGRVIMTLIPAKTKK
ncbi:lipopolysaccharide transport periplasmic protein LptA [Candidatus Parabeggiatoa sp. HSG14]|uniref:lipopolysaccharide transport periplasmic protein LptA n=1 Tax=Candidatus Parabeggiatoa sp. HSG14 TaxID=3055593 RepID=UPI0025A71395|nr:lipopolysaccharide transport periplasmic protein LptA [Thiotrichales bacterium HSG14]